MCLPLAVTLVADPCATRGVAINAHSTSFLRPTARVKNRTRKLI
jgi:hypothetical protein